MSLSRHASAAEALAADIGPLFSGEHPAVVSAALADLTAMLIAGHAAELREQILTMHIELIRKLIPLNVRALEERNANDAT
jgi:hypothetical protein